MSSTLKVGDSLPSGITFSYIPYTPENGDITSCGIPINYDASKGTNLFMLALYCPNPLTLALYLSISCQTGPQLIYSFCRVG